MTIYYDEITVHKVAQAEPTTVKAYLSNQRHYVPCDSAGNIQSYTNAQTAMRVFIGMTDDTANWTFARADSSGVATTMTGNVTRLATMSADTAYTDITATKSGQSPVTLRIDWIKSKAPASNPTFDAVRGPVTVSYATTLTTWDAATAAFALSDAGFGAPKNRDMVTLYNAAAGWVQTRFYLDGAWLVADAYFNGNMVIPGTFSADRIVADSITATQIRSDSVTSFTAVSGTGSLSGGQGTVAIPFTMAYAGRVSAIALIELLHMGSGEVSGGGIRINNNPANEFAISNQSLYLIPAMTNATLPAGQHTVFVSALTHTSIADFTYELQLLRSYR